MTYASLNFLLPIQREELNLYVSNERAGSSFMDIPTWPIVAEITLLLSVTVFLLILRNLWPVKLTPAYFPKTRGVCKEQVKANFDELKVYRNLMDHLKIRKVFIPIVFFKNCCFIIPFFQIVDYVSQLEQTVETLRFETISRSFKN